MIIQTSSVGTNASRRYNLNQYNYTEHREWDNATGEFFQESCSESVHVKEEGNSRNGEAYILNMDIAPYDKGNIYNHDAKRTRKLLLHKNEILILTNTKYELESHVNY